ncbi:MAG: hypothetical protein RIF36_15030 [Imperialibacter sp.]|uniref:hypothetical protein n=1 Tax=Imperialibacter sp. TaxID=2038411 RepID=UPI0032EFAB1E
MKKIVCLLLYLVGYESSAQDSTVVSTTNFIYMTVGSTAAVSINANFERTIIRRSKDYISVKAGVGHRASFTFGQRTLSLGLVQVFGCGNKHFEWAAGVVHLYEQGFTSKFVADVKAGYRYSKPKGHFLFRTGLGYPEGVYASVGIAYQ